VEEFYDWACTQPNASIGTFRLEGGRLDVEDGVGKAPMFVAFLHCFDGSRIGWWRPDLCPLEAAPVAILGGEGDLAVIARSAEQFLLQLATASTAHDDLDLDLDCEKRPPSAALLEWLGSRRVRERTHDARTDETRELKSWFEQWRAGRAAVARASTTRHAVASLLRQVVELPPAGQPWVAGFADLILTGTQCELYGNLVGQKPLPLPSGFDEAARRLRDEDAKEFPEAGLWFRAKLQLDHEGVLTLRRRYIEEPNPRELRLDNRGLVLDAQAYPRAAYWMPSWLARRIRQAPP